MTSTVINNNCRKGELLSAQYIPQRILPSVGCIYFHPSELNYPKNMVLACQWFECLAHKTLFEDFLISWVSYDNRFRLLHDEYHVNLSSILSNSYVPGMYELRFVCGNKTQFNNIYKKFLQSAEKEPFKTPTSKALTGVSA